MPHDPGRILIQSELEPELRACESLTEYSWEFRYPGDPDGPSSGEATEVLRTSREVFNATAARLPREIVE